MKFLPLTAALTLIATPAAAMDYVKCEAMNQAAARVRVSRKQAANDAGRAALVAAQEQKCGPRNSSMSYLKCANSAGFSEVRAARSEASVEFNERLAKIQADYEAEGCY